VKSTPASALTDPKDLATAVNATTDDAIAVLLQTMLSAIS
jgi:hypothetical protein